MGSKALPGAFEEDWFARRNVMIRTHILMEDSARTYHFKCAADNLPEGTGKKQLRDNSF